MNPDTCGRGDSIRIRICVDEKLLNPERKVYGFKSIPIRVDGA